MAIDGGARRVLAAVVLGLSIAWLYWTIDGFTLSDSHAYRVAAERLLAGADLYQPASTQDEAFRYAPWFAAAWIPLAALPKILGDWLWATALIVASVFAVMPLARHSGLIPKLLAVLGATVLLWTSARGNVHPLVMVALVHGLNRPSGPIWLALAASLKAVPILFVLVYVARREWWRAVWTVAIAAALVAPMPLLGWEPDSVQPGPSISLYYQVSPTAWLVVAAIAILAAVVIAIRLPRIAATAAAVAAILALPRLLLYDLTYLLVGADNWEDPTAPTGAKIEAPGPS